MFPPRQRFHFLSALATAWLVFALFLAGCGRVQRQASAAPQTIPFEFIGQWGTQGDAPGQLNDPVGPALDGFGRVYLVNRPGGSVEKFDAFGSPLLSFDADSARRASAVAIDPGGGIYIANVTLGEVRIFFPEGDFLRTFSIPPQHNLESTFGFGISDDGTVYVPDAAGGRVLALSSQGKLEHSWKVAPATGGKLSKPTVATIGPDGFLYIGDSQGDRVVKFTREGMQVGAWDDSADAPAPLLGLAVSSNAVFMLRGADPRVVVWTLDGQRRFADNLGGRLDAAPKNAGSLAVNSASGELIVLDPGAARVLRFRIHL